MQSLIAVVIIELMYLLGVRRRCWPGWKECCLCLKLLLAVDQYSEQDVSQLVPSSPHDGYVAVPLIACCVYC